MLSRLGRDVPFRTSWVRYVVELESVCECVLLVLYNNFVPLQQIDVLFSYEYCYYSDVL